LEVIPEIMPAVVTGVVVELMTFHNQKLKNRKHGNVIIVLKTKEHQVNQKANVITLQKLIIS